MTAPEDDRPTCPICGPDKVIPDCPYDHPAPVHDGPVGEVPPRASGGYLAGGVIIAKDGGPDFIARKPDPYQALLTQLHEVKTREATLRAGIERLVRGWEDTTARCLAASGYTYSLPMRDILERLRALLDGEVRP